MIKLVVLLKARPGMSRADFVNYYEDVHVPFVLGHVPQLIDYRRNYVLDDTVSGSYGAPGDPSRLPFDVMTEGWYENREQYDAMVETMTSTDIGKAITKDGQTFADHSTRVAFLVDERITRPSGSTVETQEAVIPGE